MQKRDKRKNRLRSEQDRMVNIHRFIGAENELSLIETEFLDRVGWPDIRPGTGCSRLSHGNMCMGMGSDPVRHGRAGEVSHVLQRNMHV